MKYKSLIIAGPTASGKSDFAHNLAKRINGAIINCDSVQIYRDIETISASPFTENKDNGFDEQIACQKVKQMYFDHMVGECDLYLFLGTTKEFQQRRMPNPFVVIGTFYPPKPKADDAQQLSLF